MAPAYTCAVCPISVTLSHLLYTSTVTVLIVVGRIQPMTQGSTRVRERQFLG